MPRHVRKGDTVFVTAGNDRGRTGEVLRVVQDGERVVVKGVNIRAKHLKPTQQRPQGAVVRQEMAIHISNVSPVVDGKPTRVRFETRDDGSKARIAVRNGAELSMLRGKSDGSASGAGSGATKSKKTAAPKAAGEAGKMKSAAKSKKTKSKAKA
jgi:large subunit ribosomal protein L24